MNAHSKNPQAAETVEDVLHRMDQQRIANMRIWDAVSKTDPRHTKKVNQRGGFTAISAHYQVMSATKEFGPIGIGWGYTNGAPILTDGIVIVPVTIWHGERSNNFGPVYGGADLFDSRGKVDSDAAKKAATDGLTKGLSQLGFNADVFLGRFDDNKYVEQVQREFEEEERVQHRDPTIPGITKIRNNLNKLRRDGGKATDLETFNALVHACKDDLQKIKDAGHSLWTGMGEDFDGFRAWIKARREELAGSIEYQMLVSCVDECDTLDDLQAFLNKHGDVIEALDGAESRKFEEIYDLKASILKAGVDA
jgi:hypothetical protein